MKLWSKTVRFWFVICLTVMPGSAAIAQQVTPSVPTPTVAQMEEIIQPYVAQKKFTGSILVARGDEVLLDKGYGYANLEWEIPNSPTGRFRIASCSKQFTAASILLLQERGKINVDDPLKKYMPDAPAAWDKVTIFNLLTHTSGIPDFTRLPDHHTFSRFPTTPEQTIARLRDKPLDFQPGEKYDYDNSGYVILGYLIEKLSGKSYRDFVQENIFTPLGMKDSGYDSNSAIIQHRVSGYVLDHDGNWQNAEYVDMTVPFAAGGLYSTTEDLLRWERALFGGKVLSPASLERMTTPFKEDYGFGLEIRVSRGHKVMIHGGQIPGFNTETSYYPENHLMIIILSNMSGAAQQQIRTRLAALVFGDPVPPSK